MATPEESIEIRAKTVDAATREGLRRLNLLREQVDIEVLSEGSRGILGFGAEDARVRLTPRPSVAPAAAPPRPTRLELPPEPKPVNPPPRPTRLELPPEPKPVSPPPRPTRLELPPEPKPVSLPPRPTRLELPPEPKPVSLPPRPAKPELPVAASLELVQTAPVAAPEQATASAEPAPAAKPKADKIPVSDAVLVDTAAEILGNLLNMMGINATVRGHAAAPDMPGRDDESTLILDIVGNDLGILIGRRGETLSALQYLTRLMLNHRLHHWSNVVVDVEEYKNRRERALQQLATRTAERVAATGRTLALEPMPARERRIIHIALRNHPEVHTESVGEGENRKVTIIPNAAQ